MANNVTNNIRVIGNEKVQERFNRYVESLKDLNYGDIVGFAKVFYKNPNISEDGDIVYEWTEENLGSEWAHFEHVMEENEIKVTSAWNKATNFTIHLYNLLVELDPEVAVENRFEDESYENVGGMLVHKGFTYSDEEYFEYPDEDYEDEESSTDVEMKFYDEIGNFQNTCILDGYTSIESGFAEPITYAENIQ